MVPSRSEKEQRILEMYETGHTIREIAREVHMSFSPIAAVIRKATDDNHKGNNTKSVASIETKALRSLLLNV